ncbi:uncharacterized protein F5891DRAFT_1130925 [Suillus fuscotomentosus]|uniref:DUF6589 domain-containing protein n=1 Tax=Suillus fuscotomentosus TaxID=1912939 RepID=A0AAD4HEB5_9AGAM|nr:uncharacterized protein F5891DRAFT_1130925 [Suillus fuscotomentosus]KAG1894465.1 hypothetical protein F5891DRAFT_1130925 [Suillus fuscotomentosus]
MSEHIMLIHGDLLTKERLDTVHNSRCIEHTPKNHFQYVIFLPGLFHYKMACADAIWRTYIQPKEGRDDENSLYQHTAVLRPEETGKMVSKPGFRQVHDVIHHDIWASMMDCWQIEAENENWEWNTLETFAASEPIWDDVVAMSHTIVRKYVATTPGLDKARARPSTIRDKRFENQMLRNRDELMYIDVCQAMNTGDIGRVEVSFLPWIYIFKATGKHKYASQMTRFLINLQFNWPEKLRNNLYTKVIYRGGGPNGTLEHIIKESPLIKVYHNCHVVIENRFHLQHQTIRHAQPEMMNTIRKLSTKIKENYAHIKKEGRKALWSIPDQINEGMVLMQEQKIVSEEETGVFDVDGDDFID